MTSLDRSGCFIAGIVALILSTMGSEAFGHEIDKKIDVEMAQKFALAAVKPAFEDVEMSKMPDDYAPPFIMFEGADFQLPGSFMVGHFAVNPWTGDVWDTGGFCRRLTTPALKEMQAKIRRSFSRKEKEAYDRLHKLKPWCDADPVE